MSSPGESIFWLFSALPVCMQVFSSPKTFSTPGEENSVPYSLSTTFPFPVLKQGDPAPSQPGNGAAQVGLGDKSSRAACGQVPRPLWYRK